MRSLLVLLAVVLALVVVCITLVRHWLRNLGMDIAELLSDPAFGVLCETNPTENRAPLAYLSLCVRLHCAHVQRRLMKIPVGMWLVGFVRHPKTDRRIAAVLRDHDVAVVVFRCAVTMSELVSAVDFRSRQCSSIGRVHSGIWALYRSFADRLVALITEFQDVVLCGYSIGASLATLAAVDLLWVKNIELVTFATPACVDQQCADALAANCRVLNYVNTADFVTTSALFVQVKPIHFYKPERNPHAYCAYFRGIFCLYFVSTVFFHEIGRAFSFWDADEAPNFQRSTTLLSCTDEV